MGQYCLMVKKRALGSDGTGFKYQLHYLVALRLDVLPILSIFSSV